MDYFSAIKAATDGKFARYHFMPDVVISTKSPFSGHIVDDLCYWWINGEGRNRSAPFNISRTTSGNEMIVSDEVGIISRCDFCARNFGVLTF